ncbi:hypothetical protein FRC09_005707, partial [Ceratobasidium sp. 395]
MTVFASRARARVFFIGAHKPQFNLQPTVGLSTHALVQAVADTFARASSLGVRTSLAPLLPRSQTDPRHSQLGHAPLRAVTDVEPDSNFALLSEGSGAVKLAKNTEALAKNKATDTPTRVSAGTGKQAIPDGAYG